jgi:hypothetical protein
MISLTFIASAFAEACSDPQLNVDDSSVTTSLESLEVARTTEDVSGIFREISVTHTGIGSLHYLISLRESHVSSSNTCSNWQRNGHTECVS